MRKMWFWYVFFSGCSFLFAADSTVRDSVLHSFYDEEGIVSEAIGPDINFADPEWQQLESEKIRNWKDVIFNQSYRIRFLYDHHFQYLPVHLYFSSRYYPMLIKLLTQKKRAENSISGGAAIALTQDQGRFMGSQLFDEDVADRLRIERSMVFHDEERDVSEDRLDEVATLNWGANYTQESPFSDEDLAFKFDQSEQQAKQEKALRRDPALSIKKLADERVSHHKKRSEERNTSRDTFDRVLGGGAVASLLAVQSFIWEYLSQIKNTKNILSRYEAALGLKFQKVLAEMSSLATFDEQLSFARKSTRSRQELITILHYLKLREKLQTLRSRVKVLSVLRVIAMIAGLAAGADYSLRNYFSSAPRKAI